MRRWIPLFIIVLVVAGTLAVWLPGFLKTQALKQACGAMLADVRQGQFVKLPNYADPKDAQDIARLTQHAPASLTNSIEKLDLLEVDKTDANSAFTIVVLHYQILETTQIYQAKLRWRYNDGKWVWDLRGSYYAPYSGLAEGEWQSFNTVLD